MKSNILFIFLISCLTLSVLSKSQDYARHLELSLLFYEAQRAGPLPENNRIYWRHDSLLNAGEDVGVDLTGGYLDAGDNVIFNFPGAGAMTLLAWSGIEFQDAYKAAGQWEILLDTVKWETDYFIKCHPDKDTVYCGVGDGTTDHKYWYPPEYVDYEVPTCVCDPEHPGSDVAGEMAASLASASILFKEEDPDYSALLLKHAREIYEFALTYLGAYTGAEGFYTSVVFNDELAWGAAWLYKATGEEGYLVNCTSYEEKYPGYYGPHSWDNKRPGYYVLITQLKDAEKYKTQAYKYCDRVIDHETTPGGLYFESGYSDWGSNRQAANIASTLAMFAHYLPEDDEKRQVYIDFVQKQINYILGDNPLGVNYVVGAEKNSPKAVHHRAASGAHDASSLPAENLFTIYGALAGGPDAEDKWEDVRTDYQKNEIAIDYNAGFTVCLAALIHFGLGVKDEGEILEFDRAWPPKAPTPDIKVFFNATQMSISTGSGMKCSSWCVSFSTKSEIEGLKSKDSIVVKSEAPDYTVCNNHANHYLDGEGTEKTIFFNIGDKSFEPPKEFEVLCDGFHAHRGRTTPSYIPEYGHKYKVTAPGGKDNTEPLFEMSKCWPAFLCDGKDEKKEDDKKDEKKEDEKKEDDKKDEKKEDEKKEDDKQDEKKEEKK